MISTVKELQRKLGELYQIEKSYELIRQWQLGNRFNDPSLKSLLNLLSLGSMEHKNVLEVIFKNFKGLRIPGGKPKFSIDLNFDFLGDVLISLLENENVMERGYMEIYINTDELLVEKNFKLDSSIYFWIFKSLSYDERNHEALIIEYMKNIQGR